MATIEVVVGPPGSGKSYYAAMRCLELAEDGIPIITNLPLTWERFPSCVEKLSERTQLAWSDGQGGPWDLQGVQPGTLWVLDESPDLIHESRLHQWVRWLRWLRHSRQSVWLIAQDVRCLPEEVVRIAGATRIHLSGEDVREPMTGVTLGTWAHALALVLRVHRPVCITRFYSRADPRTPQKSEATWLSPRGYALYNSYNAKPGEQAVGEPVPLWKRGVFAVLRQMAAEGGARAFKLVAVVSLFVVLGSPWGVGMMTRVLVAFASRGITAPVAGGPIPVQSPKPTSAAPSVAALTKALDELRVRPRAEVCERSSHVNQPGRCWPEPSGAGAPAAAWNYSERVVAHVTETRPRWGAAGDDDIPLLARGLPRQSPAAAIGLPCPPSLQ